MNNSYLVITKLEVQKKNKRRVNVFIDEQYAFALNIMAAASLYKGQELSHDKIEELKREDEQTLAYNNSIRFLAHRARSTAEMNHYMIGKGYRPETIKKTIDRLHCESYLNDADFTRQWIDSRTRFNPKGRWALRQELLQKGVEEEIIETALHAHVDEDAAWAAVQKKLDSWKKLDRNSMQKKMYTYLSNRGFSFETTRSIFNRILESFGQV